MWKVEINFNETWITLADGYATRDKAEWAVAQWKMKHDIRCDRIFRYSKVAVEVAA